jgi:sporulation protein YlmC with PRC-barrel domain
MQFRHHARVATHAGQKFGLIERVVVDPGRREVTHLVVRKGRLRPRDNVVPVSAIETAGEAVRLKPGAPRPEAFPIFQKGAVVPAGGYEDFGRHRAREAGRMIHYYTGSHPPRWPGGPDPLPKKPLYTRKDRNVPEGSVSLENGVAVQDARGQPVGRVLKVYTAPAGHRISHLVVSCNGLSREEKHVPSAWIKFVFDGFVRLTVGRERVAGLPSAAAAQP